MAFPAHPPDWPKLRRSVGSCIRPGGTLLTDQALELCNLAAGSRIADIGCGAGETLLHLERTGRYNLLGVDFSEALLDEAATRLESVRLVHGRAETLPFEKGAFDALLCECVLSILDDRIAPLTEFFRVLKGGGFLIISDVFSKAGDGGGGLLTRKELHDLLAGLGFTLLLWETHDRALKEFAVRMILAGEELSEWWGCGEREDGSKIVRSDIGYFLLVARKAVNGNGTGEQSWTP